MDHVPLVRRWTMLAGGLCTLLTVSLLAAVRVRPAEIVQIQLEDRRIDYGSLVFSPDSQRIAYAQRTGSEGVIHLWDVASSEERFAVPLDTFVIELHFSGDGARLLVLERSGRATLLDTESGSIVATLHAPDWTIVQIAMSQFTGRIAALGTAGDIRLYDSSSGVLLRQVEGTYFGILRLRFSSDGARLVASSMGRSLYVWDAATGARLPGVGSDEVRELLLFTPDDRFLLTYANPGHTRLWDMQTGGIAGRVDYYGLYSAVVTPDGTVLMAGKRAPENQMYVMDVRTNRARYTVGAAWAAFSPDGRWLATASGSYYKDGVYWGGGGTYHNAPDVWLWDVETRQRRVLYRGESHVERLWFSPDGTRLAFLDVRAVLRVLQLG